MLNSPCKKDRKKKTHWHFIAGKAQVLKKKKKKKTLVVERETKQWAGRPCKALWTWKDLQSGSLRVHHDIVYMLVLIIVFLLFLRWQNLTKQSSPWLHLASVSQQHIWHSFAYIWRSWLKKTADLIFIDPFCVCISKITCDILCWKGGAHQEPRR